MAAKKKDESMSGLGLSPDLLDLLAKFQEVELEDFELEAKDLELWLESGSVLPRLIPQAKAAAQLKAGKPTSLLSAQFTPPVETYPGKITEVKLGATRGEGGTRGRSVVIGGEISPPYYSFERPMPNPPVVTLDVFDMEVPLSKAVKMHVKDVVGDPAAWAKLAVEKFGADMVTIHLISIDPLLKDATPKDACKTVEKVLQSVDVP
ncbi:TPA: CO dehydrogenase/acetyl-CoA synthase subunit delta, partial [Candidatus Bathyarchaeota archaeon]|nr:CO dehydrogenase/acetyl-CoA synthase subunit delta [Candidatus Bathyarchaeota archaeon]HIJ09063.1 CO dehydrogenase/acetyl-CoA synthase subunit delta [Candidatus Bathyarchaeota archaeon]